jgi:gliding motility-associated-like protein
LSASVSGTSDNPLGNSIFIPNAFSPNGDGHNDVFLVYGTNIASVEMRIYTQWGHLLFESKDRSRGWDGTYSGVIQPIGVYVYVIKATLQDGTVIDRKGSVNLIR